MRNGAKQLDVRWENCELTYTVITIAIHILVLLPMREEGRSDMIVPAK